ncbi:hypothetical protein D9M72_522330 [compost metagenome]
MADGFRQIVRPIDKRRQAGGCRQAEADGGDMADMLALDHGIGEMRRSDHHDSDLGTIDPGFRNGAFQCLDDTGGHVFRRRSLDPRKDVLSLHDDSVGVGTTDIYSQSIHG